MSDILLLVESPKMAPRAARVASAAFGRSVKVEATVGHLYDLPAQGSGKQWGAIHSDVVRRIGHAAAGKRHIIIATDPDDEGERIAWQASSLLKRGATRIRVSSWDDAGFKRGMNSAGFDRGQAERAEARRICDRVIGWKCGAPGRVKAHMLAGALKKGLPKTYSWGGVSPPPNLARFSLAAAVGGTSVKAASDFLAQSWLNGQLSYPRTDGEDYGPESLQIARSITIDHGFPPFPEPMPGFHGSHEALLPLEGKSKDSFLMRVVRDMVSHAIAQRPYQPREEVITGLPNDARWLLAAWRDGVGRPGTWADHIERLRELGVFDVVHDFYERRARDLLEQMPDAFSDLDAHQAFYRAISEPGDIAQRIQAGLSVFGIDDGSLAYDPSWGEHNPEDGDLPCVIEDAPKGVNIRWRAPIRQDLLDRFAGGLVKANAEAESVNEADLTIVKKEDDNSIKNASKSPITNDKVNDNDNDVIAEKTSNRSIQPSKDTKQDSIDGEVKAKSKPRQKCSFGMD